MSKTRAQKPLPDGVAINNLELLGEIISWNSRSEKTHSYKEVLEALKDSDFSTESAGELLPRHAFSRASKKLAEEERLIHVVTEDGDTITFQFTKKAMQDKQWKFSTETFLVLNKLTGKVSCDIYELEKTAQDELNKSIDTRTPNDISKIVQRLFDNEADLFPVRDQGGVYFVPKNYNQFTNRIENFLNKLGGNIKRFPVPAGTQTGGRAVKESIESSLNKLIDEYNFDIAQFGINTRNDTMERVADKIKKNRVKIEAYANLLEEEKEKLLKKLNKSNQLLIEKIDQVTKAKEEAPQHLNGGGTRTLFFGYPTTAVIRWMGKEGWSMEKAKRTLRRFKQDVAEATIRAQLTAGRQGTRGDPAKLSEKQIQEINGDE